MPRTGLHTMEMVWPRTSRILTTTLRTITNSAGFWGADERFQTSLRAFENIADAEAKKPGRKLLIWTGPGWPLFDNPRIREFGFLQGNWKSANAGLESNHQELAVASAAANSGLAQPPDLREVDSALDRMAEGTYGLCLECHDSWNRIACSRIPLVQYCLDHLTQPGTSRAAARPRPGFAGAAQPAAAKGPARREAGRRAITSRPSAPSAATIAT
jgi:hypothetical protein